MSAKENSIAVFGISGSVAKEGISSRSARRPTFSVRRSATVQESCRNRAQLGVRTFPYQRDPRLGSISLLMTV